MPDGGFREVYLVLGSIPISAITRYLGGDLFASMVRILAAGESKFMVSSKWPIIGAVSNDVGGGCDVNRQHQEAMSYRNLTVHPSHFS
jgi:hypothetical protein